MTDYPSNFFPIPNQYIVVSNSGPPSKQYKFFRESFVFLFNQLSENRIDVIQIGSSSDRYIDGCIDLRGKVNLNQTSFIIKNSLGLITSDNIYAHLVKDTPFIILNSTSPIEESVPHYQNGIILEPDRKGKPYSRDDNDTVINTIKPEAVSTAICKMLGLNSNIGVETVFIGERFLDRVFEYIPDFDLPNEYIQRQSQVFCRMDVHFNLQNLISVLSRTMVTIVSRDPIPLEILSDFKQNVVEFALIANEVDEDYVKKVISYGIPFAILCESEEKINDLKLKFFCICPVIHRKPQKEESVLNSHFFLTNKYYIGRGKVYPSVFHYFKDESVEGGLNFIGDALENNDFLLDKEHYLVINKV